MKIINEPYNTLDISFWTDSKLRTGRRDIVEIPAEIVDRFVFCYLCTCRNAHLSGLYYIPLGLASHELGLPVEVVRASIDALEAIAKIRYDHERSLVWVRNKLRRNKGGNPLKLSISIEKQLKQFDDSPLIQEFINYYTHLTDISQTLRQYFQNHCLNIGSNIHDEDAGSSSDDNADTGLQITKSARARLSSNNRSAKSRALKKSAGGGKKDYLNNTILNLWDEYYQSYKLAPAKRVKGKDRGYARTIADTLRRNKKKDGTLINTDEALQLLECTFDAYLQYRGRPGITEAEAEQDYILKNNHHISGYTYDISRWIQCVKLKPNIWGPLRNPSDILRLDVFDGNVQERLAAYARRRPGLRAEIARFTQMRKEGKTHEQYEQEQQRTTRTEKATAS